MSTPITHTHKKERKRNLVNKRHSNGFKPFRANGEITRKTRSKKPCVLTVATTFTRVKTKVQCLYEREL